MALSELAVYLHLPICPLRCDYCDFYSEALSPPVAHRLGRELVDRLLAEADIWFRGSTLGIDLREASVTTVYVGGGSPTFLNSHELERLLFGLRETLPLGGEVEWTLESHPAELSSEILQMAQEAGVNRVSLGVQSFDARGLRVIGRRQPEAVDLAKLQRRLATWRGSLSVDFIGERPGQSPEGLESDLRRALELGAQHISVYPLSWPTDSPRSPDPRARLGYPDFDAWDTAEGVLLPAGFHRYEVSNFSRPGAECRHSLAYWHLAPYLGIGPGAVGTLPPEPSRKREDRWTLRTTGTTPIAAYLASPALPAVQMETVPKRIAFFERLMMGLRLADGLELPGLRREFGGELVKLLFDSIGGYLGSHLESDEERLWCTPTGRRNLDTILRDLTNIME